MANSYRPSRPLVMLNLTNGHALLYEQNHSFWMLTFTKKDFWRDHTHALGREHKIRSLPFEALIKRFQTNEGSWRIQAEATKIDRALHRSGSRWALLHQRG